MQKRAFRHILLFYFRKGKNAAQAAKKLRDVYGEKALKERPCRNWFNKFRSGDFSLKDEKRSGRPNEFDDDQIQAIIESDHHVTVQLIEEMINIPKSTIDRHIKNFILRLGLEVMLHIHRIDLTLHHQITIYFCLCRTH